jgi:hypothetical protein
LLREFSDTVVKLEKPSDIDDLVRWATNVGDEERELLMLLKLAGEVHGSYASAKLLKHALFEDSAL